MVTHIEWPTSYRIIPSRFPTIGIFDEVAEPGDLPTVIELEAATNPRVLDEAGDVATRALAAFAHTRPSRFCDGTFGVYYAGSDEATAIAETAYHRSRFLKEAGFPNERLDMRVYGAAIRGEFDDIRAKTARSKLYDPNSYAFSSTYAAKLYRRSRIDGIVYRSVRRSAGECVAVFRPARVSGCKMLHHLQYRFENFQLTAVYEIGMRKSMQPVPRKIERT